MMSFAAERVAVLIFHPCKTHLSMKSISLNQPTSLAEAMATASAKVMLQFLTSLKVDCCLAAAALVCVILWMISETYVNTAACSATLWVLHFACMSSIDIKQKGGEL